jgi:RNA polymerase sigma-70 factor, ECF subfamily
MAATAKKLGDADALDRIEELYRRHASALMALAYRILMSPSDAEDVVHDLFVGLPEALRNYQERGNMDAWLKRIVVRLALSRIRARRYVTLDAAPDVTLWQRDPLNRVALESAMAELSPSLRAVLVLKEVEGFTHAEIAAMLEISVNASEVRLHRALRQLRASLAED